MSKTDNKDRAPRVIEVFFVGFWATMGGLVSVAVVVSTLSAISILSGTGIGSQFIRACVAPILTGEPPSWGR